MHYNAEALPWHPLTQTTEKKQSQLYSAFYPPGSLKLVAKMMGGGKVISFTLVKTSQNFGFGDYSAKIWQKKNSDSSLLSINAL